MKRTPLFILLMQLLPLLVHANVVYSFSGSFNLNQPVTFTLTVPNNITATGTTGLTPDASFSPGAQLVCDACSRIDFFVDAVSRGFTSTASNAVGYGVTNGQFFTSYFFYFAPQSFIFNGTYTDVIGGGFSNQGTLIVTGSPAPEPGTFGLLSLAVTGLGLLRKQIAS